jgi:peptidoglycan hydrolase-like protein with peptidoglycan-binding domain
MATALLIATCAVGANALWYQPHAHRGALLATRDFVRTVEPGETASEPETTFLIERPIEPVAAPAADPTITAVQRILADLKFYDGKIDGLPGPATGRAIARYRSKVGLAAGTGIDGDLLIQLGIQPTTSSIAPSPAPRPAASKTTDRTELVRRIQAGLKQFGNSGIDIDGIVGQKTRTGIRDFQSMFGLETTGEADEAVYAKMREIGLVD